MIAAEFRAGFEQVARIDRAGRHDLRLGARGRGQQAYRGARDVGRRFARGRAGRSITGGGAGVMEAANRGAQEGGGLSVGFNIELPHEQRRTRTSTSRTRSTTSTRARSCFVQAAEGFVLFPGGFGTLDELFESLTLIQTGKILHFPVVLFDSDYWGELVDWIRGELLADGMIAPADIELLHLTDDPDGAVPPRARRPTSVRRAAYTEDGITKYGPGRRPAGPVDRGRAVRDVVRLEDVVAQTACRSRA